MIRSICSRWHDNREKSDQKRREGKRRKRQRTQGAREQNQNAAKHETQDFEKRKQHDEGHRSHSATIQTNTRSEEKMRKTSLTSTSAQTRTYATKIRTRAHQTIHHTKQKAARHPLHTTVATYANITPSPMPSKCVARRVDRKGCNHTSHEARRGLHNRFLKELSLCCRLRTCNPDCPTRG